MIESVDLVYDFANRLTRRDHDHDGSAGTALRTDHYLWDGGELVGVTGYSSLVFASGPAPDMVLFESATTLHALLGDHLHTVRDVINTSGTLENHLVYNSYGELKTQTGGGAYSPFHRFTGKPFDVAIGLQYNVHRWYDPTLGRWISEDPIGFGGGHANLAAYAGNSPTNRVDSMGLAPVDPLPRPVEPTWRPIRIFADGAIGPFSIGAQLSDGFDLVPDIDVPFILQNLADLDQLGPAQGQLGFEAPWGAGGVSLSDSGLEGALELDFEHVDVSLTALGEIFNVSFVGDQTIVTVSSSGPNVNVQGLLLLGDYGGLGFSADGSGFMGQVQLEGPLGTIGGIFGNQGSSIIVTVPINQGPGPLNFDGWLEGNLNLNFGTGSFPPAGLSLPGFIPGNPNSWMPSGGTTVEVNVELQPRPRGRR